MTMPLHTLDGTPVTTSPLLPEGEIHFTRTPYLWGSPGQQQLTVIVGMRPDDHPTVIARKIVREGMRDILAWLTHPPIYLTGREVLAKLAGHPVWTPRQDPP